LDERRRIDLGDFGLAGDQQLNRLQRALRDENFKRRIPPVSSN